MCSSIAVVVVRRARARIPFMCARVCNINIDLSGIELWAGADGANTRRDIKPLIYMRTLKGNVAARRRADGDVFVAGSSSSKEEGRQAGRHKKTQNEPSTIGARGHTSALFPINPGGFGVKQTHTHSAHSTLESTGNRRVGTTHKLCGLGAHTAQQRPCRVRAMRVCAIYDSVRSQTAPRRCMGCVSLCVYKYVIFLFVYSLCARVPCVCCINCKRYGHIFYALRHTLAHGYKYLVAARERARAFCVYAINNHVCVCVRVRGVPQKRSNARDCGVFAFQRMEYARRMRD